MKKLIFTVVVLLFATATFAVAADQKVVPTGPMQMTDAEMAQVVGGVQVIPQEQPPSMGNWHDLAEQAYDFLYDQLSKDQQKFLDIKLGNLHDILSCGKRDNVL
jgi:hypothetical protein